MKLPEPYIDCVVKHKNGSVRIARLNHDKSSWMHATYFLQNKGLAAKNQYSWAIEDVVSFKEIDMSL